MAYTPVWPAWKDSMACRSNDHGLSLLNGIVDSFRITDLKSRTNRWFPFFVILDIRPAPPCIPQIRPLADLFLHHPVTLFNGAIELVPIAINLQEIIIGEFSPVLLKMSLELVPTLFELFVVHDALLCFLKLYNPVATLVILSPPRRRLGRVLARKPLEEMPDQRPLSPSRLSLDWWCSLSFSPQSSA